MKAPAKRAPAKKSTPARSSSKKTARKAAPTTSAPKQTGKKLSGRNGAPEKSHPKKAVPARPAGSQKPQARRVRKAKLDGKALAGIKERLVKQREDLSAQISEIDEESFDGTQSDLTGEASVDEDFADSGTATFDRERALSIQNNIRDLIDQITRAIARIDEGAYGICERCARPIDAARLRALPHALLCMDCKRREERTR